MLISWLFNHRPRHKTLNLNHVVAQLVVTLFEAGDLAPLVNTLEDDRDEFGMREVASAINTLCRLSANQARAITEDLVEVVMIKLKNQVLVSEMLEILALLSTNLNSIRGWLRWMSYRPFDVINHALMNIQKRKWFNFIGTE